MGNLKKIRIEIKKAGMGSEAHEYEYCPLEENDICRVENIVCKYGLTAIRPPVGCPMTHGEVTMTFKIID